MSKYGDFILAMLAIALAVAVSVTATIAVMQSNSVTNLYQECRVKGGTPFMTADKLLICADIKKL